MVGFSVYLLSELHEHVYNVQHINHEVTPFLSAEDGGILGRQASSKSVR
jgi:hypothetical protein